MANIHIFPTANNDRDREVVDTAINGGTLAYANGDLIAGSNSPATPGDTIIMHYEKETAPGSKTNDGLGAERWRMDDPNTDLAANDITVKLRSGSMDWFGFISRFKVFVDSVGATHNKPVLVEKGVTIKGEESGGTALTEIGLAPGSTRHYSGNATGRGVCYFTVGADASAGKARFENLKFYDARNAFFAFQAFETVNCDFTDIKYPADCLFDKYLTYPNYSDTNPDYSAPDRALVKDCSFLGVKQYVYAGGAALHEGNAWTVADRSSDAEFGARFTTMPCILSFGFDVMSLLAGTLVGHSVDVSNGSIFRNNTYTGISGDTLAWDLQGVVAETFQGTIENLLYENNTMVNFNSDFTGRAYFQFYRANGGSVRDIRAVGNTITSDSTLYGGNLWAMQGRFGGTVSDCLVSDNDLNLKVRPDQPIPCVHVDSSRDNSIVKNDWTGSDHQSFDLGGAGLALYLPGTVGNLYFEPAHPGNKWATDFSGGLNRVIGGPANKVEKPAGIGATVSDTGGYSGYGNLASEG